jgi:hypothetical protein
MKRNKRQKHAYIKQWKNFKERDLSEDLDVEKGNIKMEIKNMPRLWSGCNWQDTG